MSVSPSISAKAWPVARLAQLTAASRALTAELEPADQSALVTFDTVVSLPCPLSTSRSCVSAALNAATPQRETALVDGVFVGMMVGESEVGRSLLMVFSDGLDTASFLNAERVLELGRRSDVVVYPVTSKGARPDFLDDLASLTGGRLHEVDARSDLSATFRSILEEFRYRYLVTYTPRGVPRGGWHKLDVRVNRPGAIGKGPARLSGPVTRHLDDDRSSTPQHEQPQQMPRDRDHLGIRRRRTVEVGEVDRGERGDERP